MTMDDYKERIMEYLIEAICNYDEGERKENRIHSEDYNIIDREGEDSIKFYAPAKFKGKNIIGKIKLEFEVED